MQEIEIAMAASYKSSRVLELYQKAMRFPFGSRLFSMVVARVAPYFSTIKPLITVLRPNYCECFIKKRRVVQNHIKTVHVIAICNGLEMAMGVMASATIAPHLRWIPKGMNVNYVAKATTDIRCVAEVNQEKWPLGDLMVKVTAYDTNETIVVEGEIKLWISENK